MRLQRTGCSFCIKVVFYTELSHQFNCSAGNWQNRSNDQWGAFLCCSVDNDLSISQERCRLIWPRVWLAGWLHGRMQRTACTEAINAHCTCDKYLFQTNSTLIAWRPDKLGHRKVVYAGVRLSMAPSTPSFVN